MASNSLGYVTVGGGEEPRALTTFALETISGGQFVVISGAFNAVGSQTASFATSDLKSALVTDSERVNGIAMNTATSGNKVTVVRCADVIVTALGSVLQGTAVEAVNHEGVRSISSGTVPTGLYTVIPGNKPIGRALTAAGSENYALIGLNL